MRIAVSLLFLLVFANVTEAQTGPCTESLIKEGKITAAEDAFAFMPPYGKPVIGKPAIRAADKQSFSGRTNMTASWLADHRIVVAPSGDMAYESGTRRTGYDEGGKHHEFDAAMLIVYQTKNSVCQRVALTMHPLAPEPKQ